MTASNGTAPAPVLERGGLDLKERWPVLLVGILTLANGLLGLLLGLVVRLTGNPRVYDLPLPFGLYHWSRLLTLVFGFLLLYLSFHLFQRRRTAWWLACISLAGAVLAHIGHGRHLYLAAVPAVTLVLLLVFNHRFTVRSEPRSIARGLGFMAASLFVALAYGTLGFWLLDKRDFGIEFQWGDALVRTLKEYLLLGNYDLVPHTRHAVWFLDALSVIGITAVVFAVYSLFRPIAFRLRRLPHERMVAAGLLERHARSPESYFALLPDKSYFFGHGFEGFIAYRVAAGVAVCLTDPIAPADEVATLTRRFLDYCSGNGWTAALLYTLPDFLPVYEQLGLRSLKVGTDAVVDLERFCADTSQSKQFRRNRRRLEEDGYFTARYLPPHPAALVDQVEQVSAEWLAQPGRHERSFGLGSFSREYAGRTPLTCVLDPDGRVAAFANETPAYRPGMATIDMMRYRAGLPHGIMDFLFTELFFRLRDAGFRQFDLGLAPLAGVGDRPGSTVEERVVRQLFELLSRYFPFEGLRAYKAKFEPDWHDRFLVYQGGAPGLVRTALALSRVLG